MSMMMTNTETNDNWNEMSNGAKGSHATMATSARARPYPMQCPQPTSPAARPTRARVRERTGAAARQPRSAYVLTRILAVAGPPRVAVARRRRRHGGQQRGEPARQNPEPGAITMQPDASDRVDAGAPQVRTVLVPGRVPQSPRWMEARRELDHIADDQGRDRAADRQPDSAADRHG